MKAHEKIGLVIGTIGLLIGLISLIYTYIGIPDDRWEKFCKNPYWHFFCDLNGRQIQKPILPTSQPTTSPKEPSSSPVSTPHYPGSPDTQSSEEPKPTPPESSKIPDNEKIRRIRNNVHNLIKQASEKVAQANKTKLESIKYLEEAVSLFESAYKLLDSINIVDDVKISEDIKFEQRKYDDTIQKLKDLISGLSMKPTRSDIVSKNLCMLNFWQRNTCNVISIKDSGNLIIEEKR
jgi:hypothetical protein